MIQIESVSTCGFKGIKNFEFEAKNINIITGRNNSGKTSLLESIYTAYNPEYVDEFGENEKYLVNQECERTEIETEFRRSQTRLKEFSDGGEDTERTLRLWSPCLERAIAVYRRALDQVFEMNQDYPLSFSQELRTGIEEQEEIGENIVRDTIQQSISDITKEELHDAGVPEAVTIVEVDGSEFPHVYLGSSFDTVKSTIVDRSIDTFLDRTNTKRSYSEESTSELKATLGRAFSRLLVPRFGRSKYIEDRPDQITGVNFLAQPLRELSEIDMNKNNTGVRLSHVETFVKENDMLPGLEKMYPDKFVFSGAGDPYDVPPEFVGDGLKTVIGVLWEMLDPETRGNVVLMEEPEKHMHPGYVDRVVRELIQLAIEDGTQLFISSHDLDFIESFMSETIREEHIAYLRDEFQVVQLSEGVGRTIGYESARRKQIDLGVDLRGI